MILVSIMLAWNLWFNIDFKYMWAGGNIFLILNTIFIFIQGYNSVFLIFEIPFFLTLLKPLRYVSIELAFWYNIIYGIFLLKFRHIIKKEPFEGNMFTALFLAYNLIINFPVIPINLSIIAKEQSLEYV